MADVTASSSSSPLPQGVGYWEMRIDDREKRRDALIMQVAAFQKRVRICRLNRGDYAFVAPNNTLRAAFELKSSKDMWSTICSGEGRYREQARGMCDDLKEVPFKGYIYLHQNDDLFIPESMRKHTSQENARQRVAHALMHIQVELGLHVIHIESEAKLAARLVRLMSYLEDDENRFHAPDVDRALALSGKKKFKTQKDVWTQQLRCIDKVSAPMAVVIAQRYPCAKRLLDAFQASSAPTKLLIGLPVGSKKIGKIVSKRIYQCFTEADDSAAAVSASKRQRNVESDDDEDE